MNQKTIKNLVSFSGCGIHSGKKSNLVLYPADTDTGIVFFRVINNKKIKIPLSVSNIGNLNRSVGILKNNIQINTIEHLLASLFILKITNINIEIDNDEIPIMDGSSFSFISKIKKVGIKEQNKKVKFLCSKKNFIVQKNDSFISYIPSDDFRITYVIDFPHKDLKNKSIHIDVYNDNLIKDISRARTFGFEKEIEYLLNNGLGRGGNLQNTVILTKFGYKNKSLRYIDEPLRHKVLDFLGDMYISNMFIKGHIYAYRSGHSLDFAFLKELIKNSKK